MKLFLRYYLLCDNCNWEFTGFALPGTVTAKPVRSKKKSNTSFLAGDPFKNEGKSEKGDVNFDKAKKKLRKKVKVKF